MQKQVKKLVQFCLFWNPTPVVQKSEKTTTYFLYNLSSCTKLKKVVVLYNWSWISKLYKFLKLKLFFVLFLDDSKLF